MKRRHDTINMDGVANRAVLMAQRAGFQITEDSAEAWFLAALAEEELLIKKMLNTRSGKKISANMAGRMHARPK